MSLESENRTKLQEFFGEEYRSLKFYVKSRIQDTANRDAEDIIQDVALKLFSGADRYAPINNVAGFVYKSIRNSIIDIMRSPKKMAVEEIDNEYSNLAEMLNSSGENHPSKKTIAILKQAIHELKPEYRNIIIAVDFKGDSYKEISNRTDIPQGTLMSRRHRAMGILYKKIKSELSKQNN